jgi:hypothetical protein
MSKTAVFTIASLNYLAYARTLLASVAASNPEHDRYLLLVDEPDGTIQLDGEDFTIVLAKDIGIDGFHEMAFKYDIMELNTAVKPFFIEWLLLRGNQNVIYFDPDIYVYDRLNVITDELQQHSIVVTPHITTPLPAGDCSCPDEQEYLRAGTYNLGFIAVANTATGRAFTQWWSRKCRDYCFSELETGLFVDQKWVNLIHSFFDGIKILKHPGCNVAYWNLHERTCQNGMINGSSLVFYHFSGIQLDHLESISKYQNRYSLKERPDLVSLFEAYKSELLAHGYNDFRALRYKYNFFSDGSAIPSYARVLYRLSVEKEKMPFDASCNFVRMIKEFGITCNAEQPSVTATTERKKVDFLNWLFYLIFRALGWRKYMLLMKYFKRISVPSRQGFILEKMSKGQFDKDGRLYRAYRG